VARFGDDDLATGDGGGRLLGFDGDDTLTGGAGRDTLDGGAGDDAIDGDAGNDVLIPGPGGGTLRGGAGADFFAFRAADAGGAATVLDFDRSDKLLLEDRFFGIGDARIDLRPLAPEALRDLLAEGRIVVDRATLTLSVDPDGAAGPEAPEEVVTFAGRPVLGFDDVLLF
jgi:Ca2+-binding RTX toxin-like protein